MAIFDSQRNWDMGRRPASTANSMALGKAAAAFSDEQQVPEGADVAITSTNSS